LHYKRGQRLAAASRYDEAIPEFKKAAAVLNDDALPSYELALVYFKLDRSTEAVAALQSALVAEADYPPALSALAFYHIMSGDESAARKSMQSVRDQPRVLPQDRAKLEQAYQRKFGHGP
jgi:Flp pilus assembly protein TadD